MEKHKNGELTGTFKEVIEAQINAAVAEFEKSVVPMMIGIKHRPPIVAIRQDAYLREVRFGIHAHLFSWTKTKKQVEAAVTELGLTQTQVLIVAKSNEYVEKLVQGYEMMVELSLEKMREQEVLQKFFEIETTLFVYWTKGEFLTRLCLRLSPGEIKPVEKTINQRQNGNGKRI